MASIRQKLDVLSSPTRAILSHAEASLDYAIVAKSAQKKIVQLQQERLQVEARRTYKRRRIRNIDGGARTFKEIREINSQRAHKDWQRESQKQAREQETWLRKLRAEAAPIQVGPPKRGRAAAKEKATKEAAEAIEWERMRRQMDLPHEIEQQDRLRQAWNEADDSRRSFLFTTSPKSLLDGIPEVQSWIDDLAAKKAILETNNDGEDTDEDNIQVPDDFIPVSSLPQLPPLR